MLSLGIDIGTSGIRSAVVDENGVTVSFARADHIIQFGKNIDAKLWWDATRACLATQCANLKSNGITPEDIGHITVDGTSGSMVLTDINLSPVTHALMYDSKGFDAEAKLIAQYAPNSHITRGAGSGLARALRLVNIDSDKRARHLLHQADFIAACLIGQGGNSDVMNALKTGVEPETGNWPDWIRSLLPDNILPKAHGIGTCIGELSSPIAAEFGFRTSTQIHAGTTDSIAAFLAAAPLEKGMAVTSLGSTLAIKMLSKKRIDVPSLGLYSHRVGDVWLVGGASNTGGRVLKKYFNDTELLTLSAKINLEKNTNLNYYPLLESGERFPVNDPNLSPRLHPRPSNNVDFLHGLLDGIARIEAACYQVIFDHGGMPPDTIFSVGGGSKNAVFTQIRARHLHRTPKLAAQTEASIGAAMIPLNSYLTGHK